MQIDTGRGYNHFLSRRLQHSRFRVALSKVGTCGTVIFALLAGQPSSQAQTPQRSGPALAIQSARRPPGSLLPQHPNGPGILIFDPTPNGGGETLRSFGAGCSRWLFLQVGGRPELARTPSWVEIDQQLSVMRRKPDAGTVAGAVPLARRLGVTYVVVGTIAGAPSNCTLNYELWKLPSGNSTSVRVGNPFRLTGPFAQVANTLPGIVAQLGTRLGIPAARVKVPAETVDVLLACGRLPRTPRPAIDTQEVLKAQRGGRATRSRLRELGKRSLLAQVALVLADGGARAYQESIQDGEVLVRRASGNSQALSAVAWCYETTGAVAGTTGDSSLSKALAKHPRCYALSIARYSLGGATLTGADAQGYFDPNLADLRLSERVRLASEAVRCSTANAVAWARVAMVIREAARKIRNDRKINPQFYQQYSRDFQRLEQSYPLWLEAGRRASELAPDWIEAWYRLSQAAAFTNDGQLADQACQRALQLRKPPSAEFLQWALQLYSPRWYEDRGKLRKTGEVIARYELAPDVRWHAAQYLYFEDLTDLAPKVLRTPAEQKRWKQWLAKQSQFRLPSRNPRTPSRSR